MTVVKEVAEVVVGARVAAGDAAGTRTGAEAVETAEVQGEADAVRAMVVVLPQETLSMYLRYSTAMGSGRVVRSTASRDLQ